MKNLLPLLGVISAASLCAQTTSTQPKTIRNANGSYWRQCTSMTVTRPLRELAKEHPAPKFKGTNYIVAPDEKSEKRVTHKFHASPNTDPVVQREMGTKENHSPIVNFDGEGSSQGYVPLDCNGMVGPNDFVQVINSDIAVYDKSGNVLTAPVAFSASIFPGTGDQGDPVCMYDKFADRFIIEEFDESCYCEMMFAVSQTGDPTGAWYVFKFIPDASDFADYPKFVIWADGFYETCNCQNDKVVVYDRTKMEAGDTSAGFIVIPFNNSPNGGNFQGFFCPMMLDADGQLPPYGKPEYLFYYDDDNWGTGLRDEIVIDKVTVNWTATTGALTVFDTIPTAPFNSVFNGRQSIDQPGMADNLDALDGFFQYRIPYTRWTGYNDAVMCYPVNVLLNTSVSSYDAGLRWYELRQDTTTEAWSIYQQSTYSPDTTVNRWMPAIAMNADGSIGLGYSVSNISTVYPGVRYTGRTQCDPLDSMTLTEATAIAGSSTVSTFNRWGDYSMMSIDPSDNTTFWHTNNYASTGNNYITRIFSFAISPCVTTGIPVVTPPSPALSAYENEGQLNVKATDIPLGEKTLLDLFTVEGKRVFVNSFRPTDKTYETNINVSNFAKGVYLLRIGSESYQRVIKVAIN